MTQQPDLPELRKRLAEFMGWHVETVNIGPESVGEYYFPEEWKGGQHTELECYLVSDWHPDEDIAQSHRVRDKICDGTFSERQQFKECLQKEVSRRLDAAGGLIIHNSEIALWVTAADYALAADTWLRWRDGR